MAIQQRLPTGNGDAIPNENAWSKYGATYRYDCVDDPIGSHDGSTTRLVPGVTNSEIASLFLFSPFSVSAGATNITVSIKGYFYRSGSISYGYVKGALKIGVTTYYSGQQTLSTFNNWLLMTFTWDTNPATGQPWTVNDVNGLAQFGISIYYYYYEPDYDNYSCTQVYLEVSYTEPASGYSIVGGPGHIAGIAGSWVG